MSGVGNIYSNLLQTEPGVAGDPLPDDTGADDDRLEGDQHLL